jgi:hypothetical protein
MTELGGRLRDVGSIDEAVEFLLQHWPDQRSRKFNTARQACLDALEGKQTVEAARTAFIVAAKEAGIYVKEKTHSSRDT